MSADDPNRSNYASRAGEKLAHALITFGVDVRDFVCADLGSNTGGFVDCLLSRGARKVYAIERGYGVLDYRLRSDPRVVVMERTDARLVHLSEPVDLMTIDVGWTRQSVILPATRKLLKPSGRVVTLVKPHYEADSSLLEGGILPDQETESVLVPLREQLSACGFQLSGQTESPIRGHGGNREFLWHLVPLPSSG